MAAPQRKSASAPNVQAMDLLSRDEFNQRVRSRDNHSCVICGTSSLAGTEIDVHHIMERRLFEDGGYYLDNGVCLCSNSESGDCHLQAERTLISPMELRAAAGITKIILPPGLDDQLEYDKWGCAYLPGGGRAPGPLFYEEGVQKILKEAGVLDDFQPRFKYPRTLHLPNSPNRGADGDHAHSDYSTFEGHEVVVTLKLDGESSTLASEYLHARSVEGSYHPTRTWITRLHGEISHEIPPGWRVCGENVYGQHSIAYTDLPTYFFVYAIYDHRNICLSWDETEEWSKLLDLQTVPVLYRGPWDLEKVMACYPQPMFSDEAEGFVVRWADAFSYYDHWKAVAKFVRPLHVKTDEHWRHGRVPANSLAAKN
jgi:hypothetical protein